jgi:hypothetical protein
MNKKKKKKKRYNHAKVIDMSTNRVHSQMFEKIYKYCYTTIKQMV